VHGFGIDSRYTLTLNSNFYMRDIAIGYNSHYKSVYSKCVRSNVFEVGKVTKLMSSPRMGKFE
jgi:hypothetical protein